jgi:hypothetical protein
MTIRAISPAAVLAVGLVMASGCASIEAQHRDFIAQTDRQIGEPFYGNGYGYRVVAINSTESEFIPDPMPEGGVAWTVDTSRRGAYHHPNGVTFEIQGMKKSWRFIGDPMKCLLKVNWGGPW